MQAPEKRMYCLAPQFGDMHDLPSEDGIVYCLQYSHVPSSNTFCEELQSLEHFFLVPSALEFV